MYFIISSSIYINYALPFEEYNKCIVLHIIKKFSRSKVIQNSENIVEVVVVVVVVVVGVVAVVDEVVVVVVVEDDIVVVVVVVDVVELK